MGTKRKLILFIATSLDGYIAAENDSLEWLFKIEGEGDNGYLDFYNTVDTIVIGRRTYEQILVLDNGDFPYRNKKCYVFSRSSQVSDENVEFINEDIITFTNKLKNEEGKNIWVIGGSDLLHSFIKEKLVDEFIITIAPTLLGKGISLFKETDIVMELKLIEMLRFNQFSQLHYEVR